MLFLKLPEAQAVFTDRPFSPKAFDSLFPLIKSRSGPETMLLTAHQETLRLFMFILKNKPYAAGKLSEDRFSPLSLREFFRAISSGKRSTLTLSSMSPVFFKCMLVTVQKTPTTSGTTDLINVEGLLERLNSSKKEGLVSLNHTDELNLFYFSKGNLVEAYLSNASNISKDSSLEDQFLECAFAHSPSSPSVVKTFEEMAITPAEDHDLDWEDCSEGIVHYFLKPRPELIFLSGNSSIEKITIQKKTLTIGRTPESDLMIHDNLASRDHAIIEESNGEFVLVDKNSRNGTTLNDQKITRTTLADGDEFQIGDTRILFLTRSVEPKLDPQFDSNQLETTQIKALGSSPPQKDSQVDPSSGGMCLLFMNGTQQGTVIKLGTKIGDTIVIGRTKTDLNLNDPKVSRKHASIEKIEAGYQLTDLKSTNGCYINDLPIKTKILSPDDLIKIGNTMIKVIQGDPLL